MAKRATMQDCPKVSKKLIKHFKEVFGDRITYDPGNPMLGQWAAYQGAFLKMIEYMEKVNVLQTKGPQTFASHELQKNYRVKDGQFNSALETLRSSIREGVPYELPD